MKNRDWKRYWRIHLLELSSEEIKQEMNKIEDALKNMNDEDYLLWEEELSIKMEECKRILQERAWEERVS